MRKKGRCLLALLCVVCIFGGCGKSDGNTPPKQNGEHTQLRQDEKQDNNESFSGTDGEEAEAYVQPEMKGEITISCFYEQEFLETAARQFMERYPDVTVTINVYEETSGAGSLEDYQTYLNTRIMTGKAEDIIFNSFLPVTKYSEMGVFEDLGRYISMTPEMNEENYYMNVLQAAKEENGAIYLIPYMARFDVISFSEELLSGHEDMADTLQTWQSTGFTESMDIAQKLLSETDKEHALLTQLSETAYMDYLIKDAFGRFIDMDKKQVNFDSEDYIKLLEEVKELSEKGVFDSGDIDFYNMEYYFAATVDFDLQAAFYELDAQAGQSYSMPLADENGEVPMKANGCLALNSASDKKDLAWEFIRYILSEEVQTLPSVYGLAVSRLGFEAAAERMYKFYADGAKSPVDKEEYRDLLESWMEQIKTCDTTDGGLWTLIAEENSKFFEGKQTAKETASILQRKTEQYFNE